MLASCCHPSASSLPSLPPADPGRGLESRKPLQVRKNFCSQYIYHPVQGGWGKTRVAVSSGVPSPWPAPLQASNIRLCGCRPRILRSTRAWTLAALLAYQMPRACPSALCFSDTRSSEGGRCTNFTPYLRGEFWLGPANSCQVHPAKQAWTI